MAFRKSKQNWKILLCSNLNAILVKGTFSLVSGRRKLCDDVITLYDDVTNLKFYPWVSIMVLNIPAKFQVHSTSGSKIIEGGWFHPPPCSHTSQKSLSLIGLTHSLPSYFRNWKVDPLNFRRKFDFQRLQPRNSVLQPTVLLQIPSNSIPSDAKFDVDVKNASKGFYIKTYGSLKSPRYFDLFYTNILVDGSEWVK